MLQRIIYRLLERRHYWRYISFSEMAELYASRTLRTLAVSMVSVFVGLYMYQNGYPLSGIFAYFGAYFLYRALLAYPYAYVIARIGPKHATMISNFLYVPALLSMATLPEYGVWSLVGCAFFQGLSVTLYEMSYLVDFSKVRHHEHAGRELGYMSMLEKIASSLSPLIGGLIAYFFGPQATLLFAAAVFAVAGLPLLMSPERVRTRQSISFRGLAVKKVYRNVLAEMTVGFDVIASGLMWSLFVMIMIFGSSTNAVYAEIGALSSLTLVTSIITARLFGRIVDRHRGRELLQAGVVVDSLTHMARPFVTTPLGVVMVNITNEMATTAYAMPFTKAMFAMADDLPGFRIVYMSIMSGSLALGASLFCGILALISLQLSELHTLQVGYAIAVVVVWGITTHKLPNLTKRRVFFK